MDDRRYPAKPIPGVVVIVVSNNGILLARRDKALGQDFGAFPGGAVELGETQKESVVREVMEETGILCEAIKLVSTADLVTLDESNSVEFHFLLNHYLARSISGVLKPEFPDGEVGWFHPDKLPEDMVNDEIIALINTVKDSIAELMNE